MEGIRNYGRTIGEEHGAANTLDNAIEHQIPAVELGLREGAEKGTQREDGKACVVQVLATEHVSQTSNNRHKSRGDEHEAQDHPHYSHESRSADGS